MEFDAYYVLSYNITNIFEGDVNTHCYLQGCTAATPEFWAEISNLRVYPFAFRSLTRIEYRVRNLGRA